MRHCDKDKSRRHWAAFGHEAAPLSVAVRPAQFPTSRTLDELVDELLVELAALLALLALALDLVGGRRHGFLGLALGEEVLGEAIVGSVEGLEGGGIDLDDAALHERLGAHQLVVGGVVHDIKDLGLVGVGCTKQKTGGAEFT